MIGKILKFYMKEAAFRLLLVYMAGLLAFGMKYMLRLGLIFGSDFIALIEKNRRHSKALLRIFRLKRNKRRLEDEMHKCADYFMTDP